MEFEDFKGDIRLHIGCAKEYMEGWINVNTNPDDTFVECDASWDLETIVFWKKDSIDLIYVEDFLDDIQKKEKNVDLMLASYKHILKPNGNLLIGLTYPAYIYRIAPWLEKLGLKNVFYFDNSDISMKRYIPYESSTESGDEPAENA